MLFVYLKLSVVGQLYFKNKQTNKQTHRKRDQICCYQRLGGWKERKLDEGSQKVQTSSYK